MLQKKFLTKTFSLPPHLQSFRAAGGGGEDVVRVHRPEYEVRPRPGLEAVAAVDGRARGPPLEAAHAGRRQEVHFPVQLDLEM